MIFVSTDCPCFLPEPTSWSARFTSSCRVTGCGTCSTGSVRHLSRRSSVSLRPSATSCERTHGREVGRCRENATYRCDPPEPPLRRVESGASPGRRPLRTVVQIRDDTEQDHGRQIHGWLQKKRS